jgi:hypothetical protein
VPTILILQSFAPSAATIGVLAGALIFFFVTAAIAYIAFRLLRRSIRTAVRMAVVAAILLLALAGGISIYFFGSRSTQRTKPPVSRTR